MSELTLESLARRLEEVERRLNEKQPFNHRADQGLAKSRRHIRG